jgi:hypothetical protein
MPLSGPLWLQARQRRAPPQRENKTLKAAARRVENPQATPRTSDWTVRTPVGITISVPSNFTHRATSFAPRYRKGSEGQHTVLPAPFNPRVTSFAQLATGLQPVANPSPGELRPRVAAQAPIYERIWDSRGSGCPQASHNYFSFGAPDPASDVPGGLSADGELHRCTLPSLSLRLMESAVVVTAEIERGRPPPTHRRADNGRATKWRDTRAGGPPGRSAAADRRPSGGWVTLRR